MYKLNFLQFKRKVHMFRHLGVNS